jgi:hypothetical protein
MRPNARRILRGTLLAVVAVALLAAPAGYADAPRLVSCSVRIDYLVNGQLRAPYREDFVVTPGDPWEDDFSTFTRERFFRATARSEQGRTVVDVAYDSDLAPFEYASVEATVKLADDEPTRTVRGSQTAFTSLGTVGERTTEYTLTCRHA